MADVIGSVLGLLLAEGEGSCIGIVDLCDKRRSPLVLPGRTVEVELNSAGQFLPFCGEDSGLLEAATASARRFGCEEI